MSKNFTWSYSAWSTFNKCKLQYKLKHLDKIQTPPSPALTEGLRVHKIAEQYLLGNISGFPDELQTFKEKFQMLKEYGVATETDLAVTKDWEPTTWDSWNDVWCRGKDDADIYDSNDDELLIIDFKTGGNYPEHKEQTDLYITLGFAHYDVKQIRVQNWYLNTGERDHEMVATLKQWPAKKKKWAKRAGEMESCKKFKASKGASCCNWCPYNSKGLKMCDGDK